MLARTAILSAAVFVAFLAPLDTHAVCGLPDPDIVWSLPADGDRDVPTNAVFFVRPSMGNLVSASLDGQPLDPPAHSDFPYFVFHPPTLRPNADHILELTISWPWQESVSTTRTISFRTVGGPITESPPTPRIVSVTTVEQEPSYSSECGRLHLAQDCFDVGPVMRATVQLANPTTADLFLVRENFYWPEKNYTRQRSEFSVTSVCRSPFVHTHGTTARGQTCFDVAAVWPNGQSSWSPLYCLDSSGGLGCAATWPHSSSTSPVSLAWTLVLPMALLVLLRPPRMRKQHRSFQARVRGVPCPSSSPAHAETQSRQ